MFFVECQRVKTALKVSKRGNPAIDKKTGAIQFANIYGTQLLKERSVDLRPIMDYKQLEFFRMGFFGKD